ncbi:HEAT repeat domain-containing protein [Corallococcus llansteffanensis]|uniref:HEAT repeat domain-containing protein n=1 Tax=Corallococcus llansteffanensis TaxID=2316731 RepID=A0A3A8N5P0_9BACT|nr:HEAT repeat domain-containing protein [Corallococcus llansteffanensis]RKH38809.1 HEAT repeat domain-containing protein [Corallococcus llansteffanensis]
MTRRSSFQRGTWGWLAFALVPFLPLTSVAQSTAPSTAPALQGETCSVPGLMDQIRRGLASKSPAYQRYLRALLREAAVTLPGAELQAAFERETDPVMAEHLAAALVARSEREADRDAMQAVAKRALEDRDPAVRSATVRAMRRTGALEKTGDLYERLMRDASPEVRMEAATNLVEDNKFVYAGQHGPATDTAVAAAAASTDPKATARILATLNTEKLGAEAAGTLQGLLRSDSAEVRRSAALALGGVPAEQMSPAREALVSMYRGERDAGVRKALVQGIAQLGFASAVPELQRLKGIDPSMAPEIDAWIRALDTGLQEWELLLREKQRLQQAP